MLLQQLLGATTKTWCLKWRSSNVQNRHLRTSGQIQSFQWRTRIRRSFEIGGWKQPARMSATEILQAWLIIADMKFASWKITGKWRRVLIWNAIIYFGTCHVYVYSQDRTRVKWNAPICIANHQHCHRVQTINTLLKFKLYAFVTSAKKVMLSST